MANLWYYEMMGEEVGPVSSAELKKLAATNVISRDTMVRPANGTTRAAAYRLKGLFAENENATESFAQSRPVAPTVPLTRTSPAIKQSHRKFDALTLGLAGGMCFFALTTIVLLFLLFAGPSGAKQLASRRESESRSQAKQPATTTTALTQPNVEQPKPNVALPKPNVEQPNEPPADILAEPILKPSPDAFFIEIARQLGVETMFVREIGDITLLVGVDQMKAYIPKNHNYPLISGTDVGFAIRYFAADKSLQEPSAGFIPINGKAEQVKLSSNDPRLIEVFDDGSAGVRGSGNAIIYVDCAGTRISIPIQIATTPFSVGYGQSDPKEIIATFGIPQRKQSHVVRWPKSETIDQMYYGPDAGSQEVGEHWEYDKLPGLAIRVISNFVQDIGMRDRPPGFIPKIVKP